MDPLDPPTATTIFCIKKENCGANVAANSAHLPPFLFLKKQPPMRKPNLAKSAVWATGAQLALKFI
jgi:hypothetical protein